MSVSPPLAPRILRGIELHLLGQAAVLAATLAWTPVIVGRLGADGYGVYVLLSLLMSYLMLLNAGSSEAVQRYTAVLSAKGAAGVLSFLLRRVLAFQALMGLAGVGLLLSSRAWMTRSLLHVGPGAVGEATSVLAWGAVTVPAFFLLQFALSVLYGAQRFALYQAFSALQVVGVTGCAAAVLWRGAGLRETAIVFFVVHALLAAAAAGCVRRELSVPEERPSSEAAREFAGFSAKSWLGQLLWAAMSQGDRVFVGAMLPVSQLGYYSICTGLSRRFNILCGAVASVVLPIFSELHGRGEEPRFRRLYLKATELSLFFVLPLAVLSFALAPQFLSLWLGYEFSERGTWPLRFLILANLFNLTTIIPCYAVYSRGMPQWSGYMQGLRASLVLVLWPLLVPRFGILGAAAGALVAEACVAPFFLGWVNHRLGVGWAGFWSEACRRPVLAGSVLLSGALLVHARASSWAGLILLGAAGALLFYGIGYRLLDREARQMLHALLREKLRYRRA